jgi:hypothetical protein
MKEWLEENMDVILAASHDHFAGMKPGIVVIDKIERILQIIELRENRDYSFKQIADYICEERSEDSDVISGKINEVSVRQIYNRYKKRYKRDTS